MLKHIIVIILASFFVITSMPYAQEGLQFLLSAHDWISDTLREVFSGEQAGSLARELLALLAIPVAIGLIPAILFWLAKRRWFPWFMECVWFVWLIQTAALVILYKLPPTASTG
jgi:glucan phosphoethanolaminetransferase (alkaline phosphatase superfamily)